jgi:hypothetical protein
MKSTTHVSRLSVVGALALLLLAPVASAFPPAPHHLIYGTIRDELGTPLAAGSATVVFETTSGVTLTTTIIQGVEPGVNYSLVVPMDAGVTADLYKATAVKPTVPFTLKVKIGGVNYLPIQMQGQFAQLGKPGEKTRLDLTLGADTDGDGLPDAWERALIAALGGNLTLADIRPGDDDDGDGMTNLQEYLAGTYAFDKEDGFSLKIERMEAGRPILKFLGIRGRSYRIQSSTDLKTWSTISFETVGQTTPATTVLNATDTRLRELRAAPPGPGATGPAFYRVLTQ